MANDESNFTRFFCAFSPAFVALFVAVRVYTWKALGLATLPSQNMQFQAQVSGILSDLWMGVVVAFFAAAPLLFLRFIPNRTRHWAVKLSLLLALVSALLVSCDVPYAEFFGSLMSLGHLRYLLDFDFVTSSTNLLFDWRLVALWILFAGLARVCFLGLRNSKVGLQMACVAFLLLVGVAAQVTKVQLNTQKIGWKAPLVLRLNFVENLFVQMAEAVTTPQISGLELEQLAARAQVPAPRGTNTAQRIRSVVESAPRPATEQLGVELNKAVGARLETKQPVYFFVLLLESFRPEESKFFSPNIAVTFTPFFDSLAEQSVVFENAFSAGGVTRAGQEAVFCGMMAGEKTSAMRDIVSLNPTCLVNLLKQKYSERVYGAWWHAGDYNFDSQGTFWKRRGFDFLLSRENFAANTPSSFWGYSDFALVERLKSEFPHIPAAKNVQAHLFLSVTNHAAWSLPTDSPANVQEAWNAKLAPSNASLTTRYTDEALKRLVTFLQEKPCEGCAPVHNKKPTLWDASVVFVVNDHGMLMPSQVNPQGHSWDLSAEKNERAAFSASHAGLVLTGGLTKQVLSETNSAIPFRILRAVSQADLFPTMAEMAQVGPVSTPADSLFAAERRFPVIVDLGEHIYVPGNTPQQRGHAFLRKEFQLQGLDKASAAEQNVGQNKSSLEIQDVKFAGLIFQGLSVTSFVGAGWTFAKRALPKSRKY